jgi:hypothetical protein
MRTVFSFCRALNAFVREHSLASLVFLLIALHPPSSAQQTEPIGARVPEQSPTSVAVYDNLAMVTYDQGGADLFDVVDPSHPKLKAHLLGVLNADQTVFSGGQVYLCVPEGGVFRYSIKNADAPVLNGIIPSITIGTFATNGELFACFGFAEQCALFKWDGSGSPVGQGELKNAPKLHVAGAFRGNWLFTAVSGEGLRSYDLTTSTRPLLKGTAEAVVYRRQRVDRMLIAGDTVYISYLDEGIGVFDISNPAHPKITSHIDEPELLFMSLSGNHLFAHMKKKRVRVYDLKGPDSPKRVGEFTTDDEIVDSTGAGSHLFTVGKTTGLSIYDISNPISPTKLSSGR